MIRLGKTRRADALLKSHPFAKDLKAFKIDRYISLEYPELLKYLKKPGDFTAAITENPELQNVLLY